MTTNRCVAVCVHIYREERHTVGQEERHVVGQEELWPLSRPDFDPPDLPFTWQMDELAVLVSVGPFVSKLVCVYMCLYLYRRAIKLSYLIYISYIVYLGPSSPQSLASQCMNVVT